jgi:hypothetical protein
MNERDSEHSGEYARRLESDIGRGIARGDDIISKMQPEYE